MNCVQIQQFLVLSKTMNMTKAAKELYITQPALSHSLSKMEDELGLKLVYRDGNRLVMTEEGRKILKDFEEIEKSYSSMFAHSRQLSEEKKKKIVLGFSGSVMAFSSLFLYGVLASFHGTTIEKIFADHGTIENLLQNGQIDFAITFPPITGENIESRILIRDPIRLAVAGRHPLLRQMHVRLEDLRPYRLICLTRDNPFSVFCDEFLRRKNIELSFQEVSYNELMTEVEKGRNRGELVGLTARNQFSSWFGRGYRSIPLDDCDEALITAISWLKDTDFPYEYKELIDRIEKGYDRVYYRNYKNLKPE